VAAGYRASKVIGGNVLNDADETIGKIDDLLVTRDGQGAIRRSVDRWLPRHGHPHGGRPLRQFADNKIVLPGGTKDGLRMLPAFQYSKE
jgi:hypothetical protein